MGEIQDNPVSPKPANEIFTAFGQLTFRVLETGPVFVRLIVGDGHRANAKLAQLSDAQDRQLLRCVLESEQEAHAPGVAGNISTRTDFVHAQISQGDVPETVVHVQGVFVFLQERRHAREMREGKPRPTREIECWRLALQADKRHRVGVVLVCWNVHSEFLSWSWSGFPGCRV